MNTTKLFPAGDYLAPRDWLLRLIARLPLRLQMALGSVFAPFFGLQAVSTTATTRFAKPGGAFPGTPCR